MNKLKYRRQFVLGSEVISQLLGWNNIKAGENLYLTYHPDLEVTQITQTEVVLTLVGYMVDPYNPSNGNEEILRGLFENANNFKDLLKNSYHLGGRWSIIYSNKNESCIFHDPCGMRQVYYTKIDNQIWCGSQPALLANLFDLELDDNSSINEFIKSDNYEKTERFWIGDKTIYKDVKHLLPNHYLHIDSSKVNRFWENIDNEIINLNFNEKVELSASLLKGSVKSIANRYDTMLAVTAGWDSRVLLAASKGIKDNIDYFVSTKNVLNNNHMDIRIPKRLSNKLRLNLTVVKNLPPLRDEIRNVIKNNVTMGRDVPKTLTIQHHYDFSQGKININGNASEIVRSYYGNKHPKNITEEYIATLAGYPLNKFAISEISSWLEGADKVATEQNINIMDLFYWE